MAMYDFKCVICQGVSEDVTLPMDHEDWEHPLHCGSTMAHHHTKAPHVHWKDYDLPDGGFKAGKEGTVITTLKQNRDYMERNNLLDANDFGPPPTKADQNEQLGKTMESIDAITPTEAQRAILKEDGLLDIVE